MIWKDMIRDGVFVFFLTMVGGFTAGVLGLSSFPNIFVVTDVVCLFVGFFMVAHWVEKNRKQHLGVCVFIVWSLGASNIYLGVSFVNWITSGVMIAVCAMTAFFFIKVLEQSLRK